MSDECEGGKETQARRGGRGWSGRRNRGGVRVDGHMDGWVVKDNGTVKDGVGAK